jgi:hypothetical protein
MVGVPPQMLPEYFAWGQRYNHRIHPVYQLVAQKERPVSVFFQIRGQYIELKKRKDRNIG